jgi:hypothetical protein
MAKVEDQQGPHSEPNISLGLRVHLRPPWTANMYCRVNSCQLVPDSEFKGILCATVSLTPHWPNEISNKNWTSLCVQG